MCTAVVSMKRQSTSRAGFGRESITAVARATNPKLDRRFFEYLDRKYGLEPAKIHFWLDLANMPPEQVDQLNSFNFEIRNYRWVDGEQAKLWIDNIHAVISSVVHLPPSVGYEPFDYNPFAMFLAVLATVSHDRIRECVNCRRYFFAKRRDARACSPACANVARVTRHRQKWRTYKQTHKRNRENKERRERANIERVLRELKSRPR